MKIAVAVRMMIRGIRRLVAVTQTVIAVAVLAGLAGLGAATAFGADPLGINFGTAPNGDFVMNATSSAGVTKPVLQITDTPYASVGGRVGVPHFREKVFFDGEATAVPGSSNEFIEFRTGNVYPEVENQSSGVGGFRYEPNRNDLTLWAENRRALSFATRSSTFPELDDLASRRLTIGAGMQYSDVPITLQHSYLVFAQGGLRIDSNGVALPRTAYLRIAPRTKMPANRDCHGTSARGRLALVRSTIVVCTRRGWRRVG